ncbi:MAG: hypothetical protein LBM99_04475 [Bacillales bacterium]|nr:hypothetical protein [Bacillales bacterium]
MEEKKGKPSIDRGLEEMNFSLVKEVEISGIFIWKSIEDIDKVYIPTLKMPFLSGHLFLSLYEASQGIERLQKIIVELILYAKKYSEDEKKNANNLLKSHYHTGLNDWILRNKGEIKFSADANRLFNILEKFYNNVRYSRYSYSDDISQEVTLFLEFGKDCEKNDYNNRSLKRLYGKALGEISRKYYKLIEKISNELNIYVYEIPYEYPTSIVFLDYYDNNLYDALQKINVSKKELFYYLTQNHFSFNKENLLDKMKTINFDSSMINSYLEEIITNRNSSTELFSFVSEHYDEMVKNNKKSWKERIGIIDVLIANTSSFFLDDDENEDDNLAEEDYNFFDTNDEL